MSRDASCLIQLQVDQILLGCPGTTLIDETCINQGSGRYFFSSGATEIRTVSPVLPGKPVNIASTKFGTR